MIPNPVAMSAFISIFIFEMLLLAKIIVSSKVFLVDSTNSLSLFRRQITKNDTVKFDNSILERKGYRTIANTGASSSSYYSGIEPCRDGGECFSGAWLGRSDHIVYSPDLEEFFSSNKKKVAYMLRTAYCEDSSNWFMHHMFRRMGTNYAWGDIPGQTVDAFDFSVLHLSTVERLFRLKQLRDITKRSPSSISDTIQRLELVFNNSTRAQIRHMVGIADNASSNNITEAIHTTVVVIPVILFHQGLGGSNIHNRHKYLELTFWSLYPIFSHIIIAVKYYKDYSFLRNQSSLPLYDVVYIPDIPDCSLPISALMETRLRIKSGVWNFSYIYFTEGDQILIARDIVQLFHWADLNPHGIVIPHRLVVAPQAYLQYSNKEIYEHVDIDANTLSRYRCCLDTGGHGETRIHWKSFSEPSVAVVKIHGVPVVMGNANFIAQKYRICNISGPFQVPHKDSAVDESVQHHVDPTRRPCPTAEEYLAYGDYHQIHKHYQN